MPAIDHSRQVLILLYILFFISSASAQWQYIGSPESAESNDFDSEGDTLIALTTGGLFYSVDEALSWEPISIPDAAIETEFIQIEKGSLYLTARRYVGTRLNHDVFRSDNWGADWKHINGHMDPDSGYNRILIEGDTLYFFNRSEIHLSYNRGDQFAEVIPGIGLYRPYYIHHHKLYSIVSTEERHYLLRSVDEGHSWDTITTTGSDIFISDISSIDGVLWKITHYPNLHTCRVENSTDDGDTWTMTGQVEDLLHGFFDRTPRQIIGNKDQLYIITELSTRTIYYSGDKGTTWALTANIPYEKEVFFDKSQLYFTSRYGFYASIDQGVTLDLKTNGMEAATVSNVASSGSSLWALSNYSVYSKKEADATWQSHEEFAEVEATRDGHLLALEPFTSALIPTNAAVSSDHGEHWTTITYEDFGLTFPAHMHYVRCAGDVMYISTSAYDMYYSTDYGTSWHLSDQAYGYLFTYNDKYLMDANDNIQVSQDGKQWEELPTPFHPDLYFSMDLVYWMQPYYFMGSGNLLLRLHQDSTAWEEIQAPDAHVESHPLSMSSHQNTLFLSVYGIGVFGSDDYGQSWYEINEGLTNLRTITLSKDNTFLYAGVDGGVWKRPLSELSVSTTEISHLNQAYENCIVTQGIVHIPFPEKLSGNITMSIISSDGHLMDVKNGSEQACNIDLRSFPGGLYYILMTAEDGHVMKRVMKF